MLTTKDFDCSRLSFFYVTHSTFFVYLNLSICAFHKHLIYLLLDVAIVSGSLMEGHKESRPFVFLQLDILFLVWDANEQFVLSESRAILVS